MLPQARPWRSTDRHYNLNEKRIHSNHATPEDSGGQRFLVKRDYRTIPTESKLNTGRRMEWGETQVTMQVQVFGLH
jgi:hypothetical protein